MVTLRHTLVAAATVAQVACADAGAGTAKFTTWGEAYIEQNIPSDPTGEAGFVDGWTLHYDKFLVVFHAITVADSGGSVAETMTGSRFVDNTRPGRKDSVSLPDLEARHWDRVSYEIRPALPDSEVVAGEVADRDMMVQNGYSVYVAGSARKVGADGVEITKTFHWGFKTATQYTHCTQAPESGQPLEGLVITNGGTDVSELTTHGDHLYYDRLMTSADPAVKTSLRFDEKAAADKNADGEVTLEELFATPIDVRKYDPSGLAAPSLGAFMTNLARTIGHYRGEGECKVRAIQ